MRLKDALHQDLITQLEYDTFIEKGYNPSSQIEIPDGHTAAVLLETRINLMEHRIWTNRSEEASLGMIGPNNNLVIYGTMNINGDCTFLSVNDKTIQVGEDGLINVRGTLTIREF